jgi:hypothetical protein
MRERADMSRLKKASILRRLARPSRKTSRLKKDKSAAWRNVWWGMPSFEMRDCSPQFRINVNFLTEDHVREFAEVTGCNVNPQSDSAWFPNQRYLDGTIFWTGPKTESRYPVCIPSKGRWDNHRTAKCLDGMGVSYRFFVEETEADLYAQSIRPDRLVVLPFHDLGQGSIPARNFIWEFCREREWDRHWVVDDNIVSFGRTTMNRRLCVRGGGFFNAMEDFVDRFDNVALAGPHERGFVTDRHPKAPFVLNSRIYSCILIDTTMPLRWRGKYNEDTDLSLRVLKAGKCTVLFRALIMEKLNTASGGPERAPVKGGNAEKLYATGDYRLEFAKSLRRQHPDVVKVVWRFNRWHHLVDYRPFCGNQLKLKAGIVEHRRINEYGMRLAFDANAPKRKAASPRLAAAAKVQSTALGKNEAPTRPSARFNAIPAQHPGPQPKEQP